MLQYDRSHATYTKNILQLNVEEYPGSVHSLVYSIYTDIENVLSWVVRCADAFGI